MKKQRGNKEIIFIVTSAALLIVLTAYGIFSVGFIISRLNSALEAGAGTAPPLETFDIEKLKRLGF